MNIKKSLAAFSLIIGISVGLSACNGSSLLQQTALSGTGNLTARITHTGTASFTTDLGYNVTVTKASVYWNTLKLISSGDDPECVGGNDQTFEVGSTEDLLTGATGEEVATVTIAKAAYCSYEITLGGIPEEAALVIKNHGDAALHTVHFDVTAEKDGNSTAFANIHTGNPSVITKEFQADEGDGLIPHPLHFHTGEDTLEVGFSINYNVLFDGVDFATATSAQVRTQILANLPDAIEQEVEHD